MIYLGDKPVGLLVNNSVKIDSGVITIPQPTMVITVQHNLAETPDFAYIFIQIDDSNKIPFGSCVSCAYGDMHIINDAYNADEKYNFRFCYTYRHSTSGNFLHGEWYCTPKPTSTQFNFSRGSNDWPAVDIDGNPIKYCWVVGKFVKEVTPNG